MENVFDSQFSSDAGVFEAQIYVYVPPPVITPQAPYVPRDYFLTPISSAPVYFDTPLLENE